MACKHTGTRKRNGQTANVSFASQNSSVPVNNVYKLSDIIIYDHLLLPRDIICKRGSLYAVEMCFVVCPSVCLSVCYTPVFSRLVRGLAYKGPLLNNTYQKLSLKTILVSIEFEF